MVESCVVVLVDLSKSFAPFSDDDKDALAEIGKAVVTMSTKLLDPPVKIYWAAISSSSGTDRSLCGAAQVFRRSLLHNNSANEIGRNKDLTIRTEACVDAVIERGKLAVDYTDISGAFRLAADTARPAVGRRVIIAFSDFVEDLGQAATPSSGSNSEVNMSGFDIIMISRPSSKESLGPSDPGKRVGEWKSRLEEAGGKVYDRHVKGLNSLDITSCIEPTQPH